MGRSTLEDRATALLLTLLRRDRVDADGVLRRGDVRRVHAAAARHGVNPILYRRLTASPSLAASLAPDDVHLFRAAYHHSRLRARANSAETADVLRAIANAGVPVIPLKGVYLAVHTYEDPALRPMLDLDVLVPPELANVAAAALLALGYEWDHSRLTDGPRAVDYASHHHLQRLVRRGRLPVELHHALTRADSPWRIDARELWRRAQPDRVSGVDVLALAPEHLLLHLVVHAASHGFVIPLLAVQDIALVAERVASSDAWPRFVIAAHDARADGLAHATLALARALLGAPIPESALAMLEHAPEDEAIVPALARTVLDQFYELPASYERALGEHHAWRRAAAVWRGLMPSPSRLRAERDLSLAEVARYYVQRPFDLVRRHSGSLLRLFNPGRFQSGRVATIRWLGPGAERIEPQRTRRSSSVSSVVQSQRRNEHPALESRL